ncbi:MAG: sulfur carrier protein ThiS [Dethiobacter sp.]|jgi:sulfur carrier protein|nr:sulfur carrier protein ThiS [Dethiobacter sp.]MBS3901767.1 sulfur carrier protein ThiS [Dethiobacter sp.]
MVCVKVNGRQETLPENYTITQLLSQKELDASYVVVQLNFEIIERSLLSETILNEGDQLEILKFLGGG